MFYIIALYEEILYRMEKIIIQGDQCFSVQYADIAVLFINNCNNIKCPTTGRVWKFNIFSRTWLVPFFRVVRFYPYVYFIAKMCAWAILYKWIIMVFLQPKVAQCWMKILGKLKLKTIYSNTVQSRLTCCTEQCWMMLASFE